MCGCERHHDETQPCTCICPEHGNFELAHHLAASRYDEIVRLKHIAEQVEAERDRLAQWKAEALLVMDGLQELGKALALPLGERITGPAAVEAAQRLRAQVAAVTALADSQDVVAQMIEERDLLDNRHRAEVHRQIATDLRAALDNPDAVLAQVRAEARDEGVVARNGYSAGDPGLRNPYRNGGE